MDVKLKAIDCLINYHYHFLLLTLCVGIFTLLCWILSILFILFFVCNILVSVRHIECSIICAKHINNSQSTKYMSLHIESTCPLADRCFFSSVYRLTCERCLRKKSGATSLKWNNFSKVIISLFSTGHKPVSPICIPHVNVLGGNLYSICQLIRIYYSVQSEVFTSTLRLNIHSFMYFGKQVLKYFYKSIFS